MRDLGRLADSSRATLNNLASTVVKNAKSDIAKWDCEVMYPMPTQHKVDIVKTLLDAAKEGFAIFNQVKGMIPEGGVAGMKIPGLPDGMANKFDNAVKTFEGAESKFQQFADVANQV